MNKKLLISLFTMVILTSTATTSFAQVDSPQPSTTEIETQNTHKFPPHKFHKKGPNPEIMKAKKAEFEKRLNLTEEQKKQIEENKIKDREKIKPIIDELRLKHHEYIKIDKDPNLSKEEKNKAKNELKQELKTLKMQADNCRKENMKNFEAILTPEQKKEFEKIKAEQKKKMEEHKKQFEKKQKEYRELGILPHGHNPIKPLTK